MIKTQIFITIFVVLKNIKLNRKWIFLQPFPYIKVDSYENTEVDENKQIFAKKCQDDIQ